MASMGTRGLAMSLWMNTRMYAWDLRGDETRMDAVPHAFQITVATLGNDRVQPSEEPAYIKSRSHID